MPKALLIIFSFLFFCCCSPEKPGKEIVLSKEKMADVIADLTLMESQLNISSMQAPQKLDDRFKFNVFKEHRITPSQYDSSVMYYSRNPEEFKKIYDLVLQQLSELQTQSQSQLKSQ